MGTNCAPLLDDIFLYHTRSGIHTVFALNWKETVSISVQFHLQVPIILKLSWPDVSCWTKDTTESITSVSYLDLLLHIGKNDQLHTSIYDKREACNFHITNVPFLSSNIPSSPAHGVFTSQLIRYARACSSFGCFLRRTRRLSSKLLKQGYLLESLKSSFRKFYGRYRGLIQQCEVSLSLMLNDILTLDQLQWLSYRSNFVPIPWLWYRAWPSPNYEWFPSSICNGCCMPAGNAYPSGHLFPSLLELVYAPIVETSFTKLAVSFLDFSPWISLGTLLILLFNI